MSGAKRAQKKAELLAAGTQIGKYHLLQRLAVGGMAELYLACAEGLAGFQKVVVVKHVLPHLATDPEFVAMFLNEARIAATLAHPNIVHVTDIGEAGGDFFYAMEFVHGRNVRELLREGSKAGGFPLDVGLTIAIAAASALEHAHSACDTDGSALGLIHRDVSPANILVSYEGTAKLTDFGIAKASQKSLETIGGGIKGKVGYMSPEQCRGETLDQRSDLFALGVVLFEITTCQRLFFGDNDFAILNKVLKGQIDRPSDRIPDYPPELEQIVLRALAADPADRYGSAVELRQDLEGFAHEARLRTTPAVVAAWMRELFGTPPAPRIEVVHDAGEGPVSPTLVVTALTEEPAPARVGMESDAATRVYRPEDEPRRSAAPWLAAAALATVGVGAVAWTMREPEPAATVAPAASMQTVEGSAVPQARLDVPATQPELPLAGTPTAAPEPDPTPESEPKIAPIEGPKNSTKKRAPRRKPKRKKKRRSGQNMDELFPVPL